MPVPDNKVSNGKEPGIVLLFFYGSSIGFNEAQGLSNKTVWDKGSRKATTQKNAGIGNRSRWRQGIVQNNSHGIDGNFNGGK
jgi:hypothetical protein